MSHHAIAETCFFVKPKQSSRKRKREHITESLRAEVFRKRIHELEQEVDVARPASTLITFTDARRLCLALRILLYWRRLSTLYRNLQIVATLTDCNVGSSSLVASFRLVDRV